MIDQLKRTIRTDIWQSTLTALIAFAIVWATIHDVRAGEFASLLLLGFSAVAFVSRVRCPEVALTVQLLVTIVIAIVAKDALILHWGLTTASLLSFASIRERIAVAIGGIGVVVTLYVTAGLADPNGWREALTFEGNLALVAWTFASVGIGTAVRVQRQYIRAMEDRALRAEQQRELEAQRRVAEERLRIARELHDAVAHQIAVISMFTGLARTTLVTSPDQAEYALAQAQTATRSVLTELQQILSILRTPSTEVGEAGPVKLEEPIHSIDDVDVLVRSFEDLDMNVRHTVTGERRPLSSAVGLAAYRVVEEALTNAHKYGTSEVEVHIDYRPDMLVLEIDNPIARESRSAGKPATSTGFGLIGMRERTRMLGGTLDIGSGDGIFRVRVEIPIDEQPGCEEDNRAGLDVGG